MKYNWSINLKVELEKERRKKERCLNINGRDKFHTQTVSVGVGRSVLTYRTTIVKRFNLKTQKKKEKSFSKVPLR